MDNSYLTDEEKNSLLRIARDAVEEQVGLRRGLSAEAETPTLRAGAFVTLHRHGKLRGCIGNFDTSIPVAEQVQQMAVAAATRDPRFSPLTQGELEGLDIEISVLTPPRKIRDVSEITIGEHGLIISQGYRRGVLLPQVATEQGWDRETFLAHTCLKAGLPPDAWKDTRTIIEVFSAIVFGENERA